MSPDSLAAMIDHTLLKPEATTAMVQKLCAEAIEHRFAAVCVNPRFVPLVARELRESRVRVCTVCGFPLGAAATRMKVKEAALAIEQGASEIDMVLWVGGLLEGKEQEVEEDIHAVAKLCNGQGALLKVILESTSLNEAQLRTACKLAVQAGASFVKTSTGFGAGGATVEAVRIMSEEVREAKLGVKASGGIRSYADAIQMIQAGATRIGASAGVKILQEAHAAQP